MAQIVVRGIDDELMATFKLQAKQRGKSAEQAVRELIERSARDDGYRSKWLEEASALRERIREKYGTSPISSAELIREDRASR